MRPRPQRVPASSTPPPSGWSRRATTAVAATGCAAASLASNRGDRAAALRLWQEILEAEPAAMDANRAAAQLLAETEGRPAALAHLARACEISPHNYLLHQAAIDWLRGEGPEAAEPAVRRLLEIHPADAWGHRELALVLSEQGRHEEAAAALEVARALDPTSTAEASVRGFVLERAGRLAEAREAFREAIRRDVDNESAIDRLIETSHSHAERLDALAFVAGELERQVTFGDGLLAFARRARGTLDGDGLLATLVRGLEARPDLWHAWSALIHERLDRGDLDEAVALSRQAVERFPLLPRLWLDRAAACQARATATASTRRCDRALRISPGWGSAARARSRRPWSARGSSPSRAPSSSARRPTRRSTPSTTVTWPIRSGSWVRRSRRSSDSLAPCGSSRDTTGPGGPWRDGRESWGGPRRRPPWPGRSPISAEATTGPGWRWPGSSTGLRPWRNDSPRSTVRPRWTLATTSRTT